MGNITKNISRHELRCRCGNCNYEYADYATIKAIQNACDFFAQKLGVNKVVLYISGPARCPAHNEAEGGEDDSMHLNGGALDHGIKGVSQRQLAAYYDRAYPHKFGVGTYSKKGFVHLDARPIAARWGS